MKFVVSSTAREVWKKGAIVLLVIGVLLAGTTATPESSWAQATPTPVAATPNPTLNLASDYTGNDAAAPSYYIATTIQGTFTYFVYRLSKGLYEALVYQSGTNAPRTLWPNQPGIWGAAVLSGVPFADVLTQPNIQHQITPSGSQGFAASDIAQFTPDVVSYQAPIVISWQQRVRSMSETLILIVGTVAFAYTAGLIVLGDHKRKDVQREVYSMALRIGLAFLVIFAAPVALALLIEFSNELSKGIQQAQLPSTILQLFDVTAVEKANLQQQPAFVFSLALYSFGVAAFIGAMFARLLILDVLLVLAPLGSLLWVLPITRPYGNRLLNLFIGTLFAQPLIWAYLQVAQALVLATTLDTSTYAMTPVLQHILAGAALFGTIPILNYIRGAAFHSFDHAVALAGDFAAGFEKRITFTYNQGQFRVSNFTRGVQRRVNNFKYQARDIATGRAAVRKAGQIAENATMGTPLHYPIAIARWRKPVNLAGEAKRMQVQAKREQAAALTARREAEDYLQRRLPAKANQMAGDQLMKQAQNRDRVLSRRILIASGQAVPNGVEAPPAHQALPVLTAKLAGTTTELQQLNGSNAIKQHRERVGALAAAANSPGGSTGPIPPDIPTPPPRSQAFASAEYQAARETALKRFGEFEAALQNGNRAWRGAADQAVSAWEVQHGRVTEATTQAYNDQGAYVLELEALQGDVSREIRLRREKITEIERQRQTHEKTLAEIDQEVGVLDTTIRAINDALQEASQGSPDEKGRKEQARLREQLKVVREEHQKLTSAQRALVKEVERQDSELTQMRQDVKVGEQTHNTLEGVLTSAKRELVQRRQLTDQVAKEGEQLLRMRGLLNPPAPSDDAEEDSLSAPAATPVASAAAAVPSPSPAAGTPPPPAARPEPAPLSESRPSSHPRSRGDKLRGVIQSNDACEWEGRTVDGQFIFVRNTYDSHADDYLKALRESELEVGVGSTPEEARRRAVRRKGGYAYFGHGGLQTKDLINDLQDKFGIRVEGDGS